MARRIVERWLRRGLALLVLGVLSVGPMAAPLRAAEVDQGPWDQILHRYVDDGGHVAYRRLQTASAPVLAAYLKTLATARVGGLPQQVQLAFWIDAYNADIVAGILEGYSPESVFSRFRFFRTYHRVIAGSERTPDDIEHIVRGFHDPRVHFALVCGATSCPVLRREAYVGARLDAQLDDQARRFLHDPTRNRIDPQAGVVELSRIFDWFKDDFGRGGKTVADALAPYLTPAQVQVLRTQTAEYLHYDWTLNAQPGQRP
jgi:Protein of unknown function, DUF547